MDHNRKVIYADELLGVIREDMTIRGAAYAAVVRHISVAPAVNVATVVHARWEQGEEYHVGDICSSCYFDSKQKGTKWRHCPHCGAVMDLPMITDAAITALDRIGDNAHGGAADG